MREDERTDGQIGLQGAAGAQPKQGELPELGTYGARGQVDVGQGVQLGQHDVDVVRADAGRDDREAFAPEGAGHGVKFAVGDFLFARVEAGGDGLDASRIADQQHRVGQLFGAQVEVKYGAVVVEDQLRGGNGSFHGEFAFLLR